MGNFCVAGSDERKEGGQVYKDQTQSLYEKERIESQQSPRDLATSDVVIPNLGLETDMLEIGDDGQMKAG